MELAFVRNGIFMSFYNWAISNGYQDNLTIERIDVNSGYNPNNCCWIPKALQSHNLRITLRFTAFGINKSIWEWSKLSGLKPSLIKSRVKYTKMSNEQALLKGSKSISSSTIYNNLIKAGILKEEKLFLF